MRGSSTALEAVLEPAARACDRAVGEARASQQELRLHVRRLTAGPCAPPPRPTALPCRAVPCRDVP